MSHIECVVDGFFTTVVCYAHAYAVLELMLNMMLCLCSKVIHFYVCVKVCLCAQSKLCSKI